MFPLPTAMALLLERSDAHLSTGANHTCHYVAITVNHYEHLSELKTKKKHKQTQGSQDEINDKANVCPSPSVQPITRACGHREATASAKPTLVQEPRGQLTGLQGSDCAVELLGNSVSMWWVHAVDMDLTSPKQSRVLKQILRQLIRK